METGEHLKNLASKAKDVLHLTEALYVAIKRDSTPAAEKYLQRAKDLGIFREVIVFISTSYMSKSSS